MTTPKQQPPSYPLRMPEELRQQLDELAEANQRSLNAEIVARLEQSLVSEGTDLRSIPSGALLHEVINRYGKAIKIEIGGSAADDLKNRKNKK